ncbi:GtrA family protein [Rhizobium sp. VS19-DR104.2]|uniref:GtrA family protein n=1 Tax=unclassified Rhizobium TaxID=2613769 RepID=UPI001CC80FC8|nr:MULTISPECIES: GtrA family protein [unclassified Rhizobium]MBZ5761966.1 GtrA family protein [Rhizobium sp. VS19-DR96]MBZ5768388.1 GtrA family protein [Rhizobium sp. VS19-DR129.2]MBZ5775658.1 GtrA family protein [Rhizobium sp. VS19-DRK62.2]MBZ5786844.1 GtrA family protein [Rhizobium sp. VS19-DR121]MBZ5804414.1 GtrA family protein [Rhizobium sp. VS19-DR181]
MTRTFWQAVRFAIVGLVNTAVGLVAIYATMYLLDTGPLAANAIGYAVGFTVSFSLNRIWTFNSSRSIRNVFSRYLGAAIFSYLLNLCIVYFANNVYGIDKYTSQIFGVATYTFFMFVSCKIFVFNDPANLNSDEYQ